MENDGNRAASILLWNPPVHGHRCLCHMHTVSTKTKKTNNMAFIPTQGDAKNKQVSLWVELQLKSACNIKRARKTPTNHFMKSGNCISSHTHQYVKSLRCSRHFYPQLIEDKTKAWEMPGKTRSDSLPGSSGKPKVKADTEHRSLSQGVKEDTPACAGSEINSSSEHYRH